MSDYTHIGVRWPASHASKRADHDCVVGRSFSIKPEILQDFSATLLAPVEQDLVVLLGALAYADRTVKRKRSQGWTRDLHLSLPVQARAIWERPATQDALTDALTYVTGDNWTFRFTAGAKPLTIGQSSLNFTLGNYVVLPFSDGLDSFLQWQLLAKEHPEANIIRVHTSSRATNRSRNNKIDSMARKGEQRLAMPVSLSLFEHPEATYRTRTFLFFSIAALAAHKFGAKRLVIGENGVGTYGPGMVPFGDEYPHRTTHPAFTRRLAVFVNRLLGSDIAFEHPQQYRTKGQVLERAISVGVSGWECTHSCTRNARNQLVGRPCGVCGGCLLRRTAVYAAGQDDAGYFWEDLSGATLNDCRFDSEARLSKQSDIDIARHGINDMNAFAELSGAGKPPLPFERAAWEVVGRTGPELDEVTSKLADLAKAHAAEWAALKKRFAPTGFLNTQREE